MDKKWKAGEKLVGKSFYKIGYEEDQRNGLKFEGDQLVKIRFLIEGKL